MASDWIESTSAAVDVTSVTWELDPDHPAFVVEVVFTGTVVGTLALQGSLTGDSWVDQDMRSRDGRLSESIAISGADAVHLRVVPPHPRFYRLSYTATSGTGTIAARRQG